MSHAVNGRARRGTIAPDDAARIAEAMQALSTTSRVLILAELRQRSQSVSELVAAVGMQQSAVSHQLRLLRDVGLVVGERRGRHVVYSLSDEHVASLVDQAAHHVGHLRRRAAEPRRRPRAVS